MITYEELKYRQGWTLEQKIDHAAGAVSAFMEMTDKGFGSDARHYTPFCIHFLLKFDVYVIKFEQKYMNVDDIAYKIHITTHERLCSRI